MSIKISVESYNKLAPSVKKIVKLAKVPFDEKYFYFPDSLGKEFKQIELDYYDIGYFDICGYYGNYEYIDIDNIVGSADNLLMSKDTWLDAILEPRAYYKSYEMAENNIDYYVNGANMENIEPIDLCERNNEYYVIDGNHRVNVFKLLTAMKHQNCSTKIKVFVRHLPYDKDFSDYFTKFVEKYKLFDEKIDPYDGYKLITPHFEYIGDNYAYPTLRHIPSGMIIKTIQDIEQLECMYRENVEEKKI